MSKGKRESFAMNDVELHLPHTVIRPGEVPHETIRGLVSCVIPSHKRSDTLKRAIDSVLNQTYKKIEVLVVDDNEKGDKWDIELKKIIKEYDDKRVRLISQPRHVNGAMARNYGIKESLGEYIAFLDDDDEWEKDKIEKQLMLQKKEKADVVVCLWTTFKDGKEIRKAPLYEVDDIQFKILSRSVSVYTSTVLIKKKAIYLFGGFDETLIRHQDLQFLVDAAEDSKFALLKEYKVKIHTDSDINRPDLAKFIKVKKDFLECESVIINKYNKKDKKRIYGAHNFELLYLSVKEKRIKYVLKYSIIALTNFPAIKDVIKRIKERNKK